MTSTLGSAKDISICTEMDLLGRAALDHSQGTSPSASLGDIQDGNHVLKCLTVSHTYLVLSPYNVTQGDPSLSHIFAGHDF